MRISFDIDDTIICRSTNVPKENNFFSIFFREKLRLGTNNLFKEIKNIGWQIDIYTGSLRPIWYLKMLFIFNGISVSQIINQDIHDNKMKELKLSDFPSKFPTAFNIDLHVDDSEGVLIEGQKFGFKVILINPNDMDWTQKIINEIQIFKRKTT